MGKVTNNLNCKIFGTIYKVVDHLFGRMTRVLIRSPSQIIDKPTTHRHVDNEVSFCELDDLPKKRIKSEYI